MHGVETRMELSTTTVFDKESSRVGSRRLMSARRRSCSSSGVEGVCALALSPMPWYFALRSVWVTSGPDRRLKGVSMKRDGRATRRGNHTTATDIPAIWHDARSLSARALASMGPDGLLDIEPSRWSSASLSTGRTLSRGMTSRALMPATSAEPVERPDCGVRGNPLLQSLSVSDTCRRGPGDQSVRLVG